MLGGVETAAAAWMLGGVDARRHLAMEARAGGAGARRRWASARTRGGGLERRLATVAVSSGVGEGAAVESGDV